MQKIVLGIIVALVLVAAVYGVYSFFFVKSSGGGTQVVQPMQPVKPVQPVEPIQPQ